MKSKYNFEFMEIDDKVMAVPIGGAAENLKAVLRLNDTAVDILKALSEDVTETQLISQLSEKYQVDETEIKKVVHDFVLELVREGIVE